MTIFNLSASRFKRRALQRRERGLATSASSRVSPESPESGCAPRAVAKARSVALCPTLPLNEGDAAFKSILDPSFRYSASFDTDLKRTFARVRLSRHLNARGATASMQASASVTSIPRMRMVARHLPTSPAKVQE